MSDPLHVWQLGTAATNLALASKQAREGDTTSALLNAREAQRILARALVTLERVHVRL